MEPIVDVLRLAQFAAAFVLTGGALFALRSLPAHGPVSASALGWPRTLLIQSGAALALLSVAGLIAQTAIVAGSLATVFEPETVKAVLTSMDMGPASVIRALSALLAAVALLFMPSRAGFAAALALGLIATASFAWMGHGAASEGPGAMLHLIADIVHLVAAAAWIGALAIFARMAFERRRSPENTQAFHNALEGFAGLGSVIVALLIGTGLVNSWFLVGPAGLPELVTTSYGKLLLLKLGFFIAMLGLAGANRLHLTPALKAAKDDPTRTAAAIAALRSSLILEAGAAIAVLAAVAWLGRMSPITGP